MFSNYMKLHIDLDSIYIKEEICGVELDSVRLNNITKSTIVQFLQFYNERYRLMPIIIKNEREFLTILKTLIPLDKPLKGSIRKINTEYICIDTSKEVDNMSIKFDEDSRVIPDIRKILENV